MIATGGRKDGGIALGCIGAFCPCIDDEGLLPLSSDMKPLLAGITAASRPQSSSSGFARFLQTGRTADDDFAFTASNCRRAENVAHSRPDIGQLICPITCKIGILIQNSLSALDFGALFPQRGNHWEAICAQQYVRLELRSSWRRACL
jgi:hypothetical protein